MSLPTDFLWGGSVSNMQTEGAYDKGGRGLSDYDMRPVNEGRSDWKVAIDFYHHYKEDIKLLSDLGLNTYRFSISWSRVIPDGEGDINEEGLKFYENVIDELLKYDIEPFICVNHFELPLALVQKYGGWKNRQMIEAWKKFVKVLVDRFGHKVKYWMPFNEQNVFQSLFSPIIAKGRNGEKITAEELYHSDNEAVYIVHHANIAGAWLRKYLKESKHDVQNGGMITYPVLSAYDCHPETVFKAKKAEEFFSLFASDVMVHGEYSREYLKNLEKYNLIIPFEDGDIELLQDNTVDFLGFSYYGSGIIKKEGDFETNPFAMTKMLFEFAASSETLKNPYLEATEWGWGIDGIGLRTALNNLYRRYRIPIMILECGVGVNEELNEAKTVEDDYRISYFRDHIEPMKDAVEIDGVDLRGFLTWGPIDILSSGADMNKRYGFIFVNRTNEDIRDLKRYKKKSFTWFRQVIDSNGENLY